MSHIARWDGTATIPFTVSGQPGVDFTVLSLATWNTNVVAGGSFSNAGGTFVNRLARWEDCQGPTFIADIAPPGGDGTVNVADRLTVIGAWGACVDPSNCPADITGDDQVNVSDLLAVSTHWGTCP